MLHVFFRQFRCFNSWYSQSYIFSCRVIYPRTHSQVDGWGMVHIVWNGAVLQFLGPWGMPWENLPCQESFPSSTFFFHPLLLLSFSSGPPTPISFLIPMKWIVFPHHDVALPYQRPKAVKPGACGLQLLKSCIVRSLFINWFSSAFCHNNGKLTKECYIIPQLKTTIPKFNFENIVIHVL